jgi:hypothetical protein
MIDVVPSQMNAVVVLAFPVSCYFVVFKEYMVEMISMFTSNILPAKIIDS